MRMGYPNRRQFMIAIGCAGTLNFAVPVEGSDYLPTLYSINYQTAIGIADEPATIVDRFGQLKSDDANVPELANAARGGGSRNVNVLLEIGEPPRSIASFQASQTLEDGYLPIVRSEIRAQQGLFQSIVFSSDLRGLKADYIGIIGGANPFRVKLLCPTTTLITVEDGVVRTPDHILAVVPVPVRLNIHNAKYNCMTPERNSRVFPSAVAWEGLPRFTCPSSLDPSFASARTGSGSVEYRFPVARGKTYRVYVGIGNPKWLAGNTGYFHVLNLTVDEQTQTVDLNGLSSEQPILREFKVTQARGSIRVRADGVEGEPLLSGIWIFDDAPDTRSVMSGKLNGDALYYARCGRERPEDIISSVDLLYHPPMLADSTTWIQLPYVLHPENVQRAREVSPGAAISTTKMRWNSFLDQGAHFTTGISRLDNLYKTSLINLFLLRTKFAGQGNKGRDIYAVKPGATVYDSFWYRDGSYIIAAMDAAGHPDEAEKSLRLFTDSDLKGQLKAWGQQRSGLWESPGEEWDSQGQAIWALVHHFELTGDISWLGSVYENIRKGVLWIKWATEQTKTSESNGEKPIFWGLLEKGVSEDTGSADRNYIYEHDFWAALGLKKAIVASQWLKEDKDTQWMKAMYREFCANLLRSVKRAFHDTGQSQFIPADPFDPGLDINGDIAAVYPTGFLDAGDPMVTNSLKRIASHSQEGLYTWFKTLNNGDMWTYMTADWAMCYLLGNDLPMFYKLFKAYTDHAAPTNNWSECIYVDSRLGTGDTPHGWAAASYVLLHRNSLVYEYRDNLELCWGVFPQWLPSGGHIQVKNAPTNFGEIDFDLRRSGSVIDFAHRLIPSANQSRPNEVHLHIPAPLRNEISTVRLNGKVCVLSPEESVLRLE
jgi:GH15 family glucan-1,4-alpha-glucosidase